MFLINCIDHAHPHGMQQLNPNMKNKILKSLVIWINSYGIVKMAKVRAPARHPRAVPKGSVIKNRKVFVRHALYVSHRNTQGMQNPTKIGIIRNSSGPNAIYNISLNIVKEVFADPNWPPGHMNKPP